MRDRRLGIFALIATGGLVSAGLAYFAISSGPAGAINTGDEAPGFVLDSLGGERISLGDLEGQVVYVNFWATWCAPCLAEAPSLQRLHDELSPDGFEILALSIDDADKTDEVEAFRDRFGVKFPILLDPEKLVYSRYGVTAVPETYLIDAEGRLAEAYIGPRNWDDPRYARAIRRLLDQKRATEKTTG